MEETKGFNQNDKEILEIVESVVDSVELSTTYKANVTLFSDSKGTKGYDIRWIVKKGVLCLCVHPRGTYLEITYKDSQKRYSSSTFFNKEKEKEVTLRKVITFTKESPSCTIASYIIKQIKKM